MLSFEVDYLSSSKIGYHLVLSFILQRPPFEVQRKEEPLEAIYLVKMTTDIT